MSETPNIGAMWGELILGTVIASAVIHSLYGVVTIRNLVFRDLKTLFIPVTFFIVGAIYSFLTMAPLAFAIAVVHFSLDSILLYSERVIYTTVMVMLTTFFSAGRTANLYAM